MRWIPSAALAFVLVASGCDGSKTGCLFDCPQSADGTVASCIDGKCTTACSGKRNLSDVACIDGTLRTCAGLANPPCDQCALVCTDGRFCAADATCIPYLRPGAPCVDNGNCDSGRCVEVAGEKACSVPLGSACVAGDACPLCLQGFCTEECSAEFGSEFCWSGICSVGLLPAPISGATGYCHKRCESDAMACQPGQSCVSPPDHVASTTYRICGWGGTAASGR